jgi:ketosteroid isomerase-like protein
VKAEVRRALDLFGEASGRGDLPAVLAQFEDAADILVVGSDKGEVFKGRAAIEGWLGQLYKGSGFSWQMDRVDISHQGDTAWAFVEGRMEVRAKATGKLRFSAPYRFSAVLVRRGEGWAWRLFHGSAPGKE